MVQGRISCTGCGAPNYPDLKFCTNCGAPIEATPATAPLPSVSHPHESPAAPPSPPAPPRSLPALIRLILTGMAGNIRGMITSAVKSMLIGFALVLVISTFLRVTSLRQEDITQSVIAAAGPGGSANALLFWFLLTAILAFFWSQVTTLGISRTVRKCASLSGWLVSSAGTAGIAALPLVTAGAAVALMVRLLFLTTATAIQFLVMMFGVLFSQKESIAVLAMSLGYSDLARLISKRGPAIPPPGFPVMGVLGAFLGFFLALLLSGSLPALTALAILLVAVSVAVWFWRRSSAAAPGMPAAAPGPGRRRP